MAGVKGKSGGARIGAGKKAILAPEEKRDITVSFRMNKHNKEKLDNLRGKKSVSDFIEEILKNM